MQEPTDLKDWLFGKYLDYLKEQGKMISVSEFAKAAGLSPQTILDIFEGKGPKKPRPKTIQALARILGPEIYDVVGMKKPQYELSEINKILDYLPAEKRQQVIEIIRPYIEVEDKNENNH